MKFFLWFILVFILICKSVGQYYDHPNNERNPTQSIFADPIRRTLGLWGRLLNRMAQTNEPTEDQLRLRAANAGEDRNNAFDFAPNHERFGTAKERFTSFSSGLNRPNTASDIIDERKLLELLPRLLETTSTSTTTTTTEVPSTTTTTELITITTKLTTTTEPTTTTTPTPTPTITTTKSITTTTTAQSKVLKKPKQKKPKKSKTKDHSKSSNSTLVKNSKSELKPNDTKIDNNKKSDNTTEINIESIKKETEELISEIEKVLRNDEWESNKNNKKLKTKQVKNKLQNNKNETNTESQNDEDKTLKDNKLDDINKLTNITVAVQLNETYKSTTPSTTITKKLTTIPITTTKVTKKEENNNDEDEDELKDFKTIKTESDVSTDPKKSKNAHLENPSKYKNPKDKKTQNGIPEAEEEDNTKMGNF